MSHDDLGAESLLDSLNEMMRPEPIDVVTGQETLSDALLEILPYVVVIAREDPGPGILEIDLNTTEALGVAWKVMQLDSLAEVEGLLIKDLPIEVKIKVVLEVDRIVHASCDTEECASKLLLVTPDRHFAAFEITETCGMVGVEVPKDNSLDVGDVVASGFNSIDQVVLLLVDDPIEDIVDRTSHLRPVLSTASFVQKQSGHRVLNQNTVHRELSTFVDEGYAFRALEGHVGTADEERIVCF